MAKSFIPVKAKTPKTDPENEVQYKELPKKSPVKKPAPKVAPPEIKTPKFTRDNREFLVRADWDRPETFAAAMKKFKINAIELTESMKKLVAPRDFRRWRRRAEGHGHITNELAPGVKKKSHRAAR